ncbi:conserved protein, unknown function [Plasmodium yoelii]|uniref:Pv-fam-g protein n=3 Tax=Plasmodium yoelii TaxID=5861 RepID=A0AAE9X103_PLAYO|nr:conserved protein, unknown function [Plasmodium yoelii]EAA18475.1 gamma-gliadin [Plasmodium yoelii yoelii]WBY59903.1 hypothetical protein Py17XNL_001303090 [Plasmodium yoelii yoelii]CDU19848.1 conserved Plasmodium protein, unknown function [Plasmodium yoelii]VTZ80605.1 conserved protein, unknown function [Plasmodium yoelii]|eukprot:XP_726910.1 conserved protein, unknown function [Plasmodium yoelii]
MGIDINTKKHSSRRHKLSKNDLTFEKPILKESTTKDSCSDDEEIEFEGWVEFITKDDRCTDENDEYEREPKIIQEKRNSKIKSFIPTQKEENDFIKNKNEKVYISSRRNSNKSNISMNDQYPRYSYISPNYFYEQPQSIVPLCNQTSYTNENKIIYPVYLSNTQECPKDGMNIIKPNYIDPPPPIVLKNTQVLPQLYIRQPPTVIVTNESRPPLVINPPPANVILKNKAPQPIYVNSTRPNIIIKNDTPSTQNPINMDTTPIQLDVMPENRENTINSSINYSAAANIKTDVNILPNSIPTNVLHLENNTNDYMASQNMPSIYMLNNNNIRPQVLYQNGLPISTINAINPDFPINNVIYKKGIFDFENTVFNPVELANSATIQPNYSQLLPQVCQASPQISQPLPQVCQASPQISQPLPQVCQTSAQFPQPIIQYCQASPQVSQPIPQVCQTSAQISQPILQSFQASTQNSQPILQSFQAAPQISQPLPKVCQTSAQISQPIPQVCQTSAQISQPIPQVCQTSAQISQPLPQYCQTAPQNSQPILQSFQASPQNSQPILQSFQASPQISQPLPQSCPNTNLLNQVTIPNSLLQAVPNHQVHTSIPQGVQSFPQSGVVHNVSQSHGSVQSPLYTVPQTMQYTNQNYQMHNNVNVQPMGYEQEVQQYRYLNTPPQVINQNYMPLHTDMRLQMRNSVIPRNGSMVPNNVVQSEAHMGKYRNHSMNKNNANIPVIHNSYNSLEKVATCGTIGCGGKPKTSPVSPLRRRSTYVNLKQDFINSPLKSVQIVSQPAINRNTRAYSTYR